MRVAHLIMAHKNPSQLARLVEKLNHPNFDIYIHIDAKVEIEPFKILEDIPNLFFIKKRSNCNWGGYTLMKGIVDCISEVLESNSYAFINMISGQDYPLYSPEHIYSFLKEREDHIFISFEESHESEWWKKAVGRYEKYHFTDYKFRGKYFFEKIVNVLTPKRKFPNNMSLYGGNKSCWWTLTSKSAAYVVTTLNNDPRLNDFLKLCWGTDEFVIPTLIMNSPFKENVVNNNLRFMDWSAGDVHPKILTETDFESIQNSQMLFARKFDIDVDRGILDKIDLRISHT